MSVSATPLQLSDYLEGLPGTTLKRLYLQPSTAFAIFRRMLPALAKTLVTKILYLPRPLLLRELDLLIKPEAKGQRDQALSILKSLHIITISAANKERPQEMALTTNFKKSLRLALEGGGAHNSYGVPSSLPVPSEITVAFLDDYSSRKWESILHYVVNSAGFRAVHDDSASVSNTVKQLLLMGRLVVMPSSGASLRITRDGFTFLLQESNAQVWTLLLLWLTSIERTNQPGLDNVDMLSFLFMLATMELGKAYDTDALSDARRNMLPNLVDFGLVYFHQSNQRQYFPTRLATTLTVSGSGALRSMSSAFAAISEETASTKGTIMLETNLRIYAYTSSPLQIAVLALFTQLNIRLPNLVTAKLSKTSVQRAIDFGISSDQIISYLATHAHEQMHKLAITSNKPVLPPTVVDQIRLWQLERERMQQQPGFLFKEFQNIQEYMDCAQYAEETGVLLWKNDANQVFFVSRHEQLVNYLKLRKKAA